LPAAQNRKPIEVVVTTPITSEVADCQDFTGRLDALKTVDIRARVSGFDDGPLQGGGCGARGGSAVSNRRADVPGHLQPGRGQPQAGDRGPESTGEEYLSGQADD